jgi:hypothetical protein
MEALGHEMWLPERFWSLTRANREVLKAFRSRDLDGVDAIRLSDRPFREDNLPTENLRRTLFP